VVSVGQGLVPGLGGGELLAVVVEHVGEYADRRTRPGWWRGRAGITGSFGMKTVVAVQLGSGPGTGHRIGAFGGQREDVGEVGVGAVGQRDQGMRAVLGPDEHGQAGVHGAALGDVVGDRVPELAEYVSWARTRTSQRASSLADRSTPSSAKGSWPNASAR